MTCSWCSKQGHNRRGCPTRKQYALDNPHSMEAVEFHEERQIICGYCRNTGHNRRSCIILKDDRRIAHDAERQWRTKFVNIINKTGLGPGSLLQSNNYYGDLDTSETVDLVLSLNWSEYNLSCAALSDYSIMPIPLNGVRSSNGTIQKLDLPMEFKKLLHHDSQIYCTKLLAKAKEPFTPPKGWIEDTRYIDSQLENRRPKWLFEVIG